MSVDWTSVLDTFIATLPEIILALGTVKVWLRKK